MGWRADLADAMKIAASLVAIIVFALACFTGAILLASLAWWVGLVAFPLAGFVFLSVAFFIVGSVW